MEDGGEDLTDGRDCLFGESDGLERFLELAKAKSILGDGRWGSAVMREVAESVGVFELEVGSLVRGRAGDQIVEDMEVTLADRGARDPRLLQVVLEPL